MQAITATCLYHNNKHLYNVQMFYVIDSIEVLCTTYLYEIICSHISCII